MTELLTAPEVMVLLKIGRPAVYDLLRARQPPPSLIGRARRIPARVGFIHTRLAPGNTRRRIRVYGTTRKEALAKLTAKDVRTWLNQLRVTCQCCTRGIDARRDQPRCCAADHCCAKPLSPLTLAYIHYIHSVLKSALEHAVREEEIPRNVARNARTGTPPRPGPPNAAPLSPPAASSR